MTLLGFSLSMLLAAATVQGSGGSQGTSVGTWNVRVDDQKTDEVDTLLRCHPPRAISIRVTNDGPDRVEVRIYYTENGGERVAEEILDMDDSVPFTYGNVSRVVVDLVPKTGSASGKVTGL